MSRAAEMWELNRLNNVSNLECSARGNRRQQGVTATPARNVSLAHQEATSDSDDWGDPPTELQVWPRDQAVVVRIRNNWRRVIGRLVMLLAHSARERMIRRWDETRYETNQEFAVPTPKVKPKAKAKRAQRRDDLVYIGRALPPNTSRRTPFPMTTEMCRGNDGVPHTQYLKATGGQKVDGTTTYSWLCQNCGARFERTDLQNATDGVGAVHEVQARAGPLQPRSAALDIAAQAAQSSGTADPLAQYPAMLQQVEAQHRMAAAQLVEQQRHEATVFDMTNMDDSMAFPDTDANDQYL